MTAAQPQTAQPQTPTDTVRASGLALGAWWLSPIGAVLMISPISLFGAWAISDTRYRSEWRTPKELTAAFTVLMLVGMVALVAGAAFFQLRSERRGPLCWPNVDGERRAVLVRANTWTFRATIFGYVALTTIGLSRGVSPASLVTSLVTFSTSDAMKHSFAPVAGISSFTQLGIVHAVVAGLLMRRRRDPRWSRVDRSVRRRLAVVLVLALLRSFLLSERLAILELAVPLLAILALRWSVAARVWVRRACRLAPVVILPLLLAVFGLFEYTRSWKFYSTHGGTSFWDFAVVRFAGYYATAYNNAGILEAHGGFSGRLPYSVFESFWTAPLISQLGLYQRLSGGDPTAALNAALAHYGNPEFNNPGGFGAPFVDLGVVGGTLYLLVLGALCGWCWVNLRSGGAAGMLVYPVVLTGLYELPRYLYLSEGRVLPALVVLVAIGRRLDRGSASEFAVRLRHRFAGRHLPRLVIA